MLSCHFIWKIQEIESLLTNTWNLPLTDIYWHLFSIWIKTTKLTTSKFTYKQSWEEWVDLLLSQCCWLPSIHIRLHHLEYLVAVQSCEYSVHHLVAQTGAHRLSVYRLWAMLRLVLANPPVIQPSSSRLEMNQQQHQCLQAPPQIPDLFQWCLHSLKTKQHNT